MRVRHAEADTRSQLLARQGHRLLQLGVALFLFTSFEGSAVYTFSASGAISDTGESAPADRR